jgi:hypothetical protein
MEIPAIGIEALIIPVKIKAYLAALILLSGTSILLPSFKTA